MIFKDEEDNHADDHKPIQFAEPSDDEPKSEGKPWHILVVDDEQEVFFVTQMALQDLTLDGRQLDFIPAFSEKEAREKLQEHDDIALILLDVVMEEDDSGLKLVEYIRNELNNHFVRIILRTGQPGEAPEKKVILDYDINDYKEKTEMTSQKLSTTVISALRSYRDIMTIESLFRELEESNKKLEAYNKTLEQEVAVRKQAEHEMKKAQSTALQHAQAAGKAQFANSVLHNIGNVLTSVQVASGLLSNKLERSKITQLFKTTNLIETHQQDIGTYLTQDAKGKLLPDYLIKLTSLLKKEHGEMVEETGELTSKIQLMKDIIETQQTHAKAELMSATLELPDIVDEAFKVMADRLEQATDLQVIRDLPESKPIIGQKSKLIHVIINLIKNAVEAMRGREGKILSITSGEGQEGTTFLDIKDNGEGISKEGLENLFSHGFTTKQDGHGFGLHFCANAMTEMGGSIECFSDGKGMGATFRLTFITPSFMGEGQPKAD